MTKPVKKIIIRIAKRPDLELLEKQLLPGMYSKNRLVPRPDEKLIVAISNGELVGACKILIEHGKTAVVSTVCVAEKFRNKNIGHSLVGKANSIFKSSGIVHSRVATKHPVFFRKAKYTEHLPGELHLELPRLVSRRPKIK